MLIKKQESTKHQNTKNCVVWEYDFPNENLGFATCKINGRYPDQGKVVNLECNEIYYIISGTGVIHHETKDYGVEQGDAFFFEKGKPYWVEGQNLLLAVPTAPRWSFEQYKYID